MKKAEAKIAMVACAQQIRDAQAHKKEIKEQLVHVQE